MGGDLSKVQLGHVKEIKEITRRNYFKFSPCGKVDQVTSKDIKALLTYIWQTIPAYPEAGSLKIETWKKIGDVFQKSPRAPAHILETWKFVIEAIQTHQHLLLSVLAQPLEKPPPYICPPSPSLLPPCNSDVCMFNHDQLLSPRSVPPGISAPILTPCPTKNAVEEAVGTAMVAGDLTVEEIVDMPILAYI